MPKKHKHHEVKIYPRFFWKVFVGEMNFQIRNNDRDYKTGDKILMKEFDGEELTGMELLADIGFITDFKQKEGYVVFSIHNIKQSKGLIK